MPNFLKGKTVLCWVNLGPYHIARATALAAQTDLVVIEFASTQKLYGWEIDRSRLPFQIITLANGAYEDQSIPQLARACWQNLERIRPSQVIVPGWANPIALVIALWGFFRRVPRILMSESTALDRPRQAWKERAKSLLVNSLYNGASFGGKPQLRYLQQLQFPTAKTAPFYNVVDNQFFATTTQALRCSHQAADLALPPKYFLYVGRLATEKNLPTLLRAFANYRQTGGTFDLLLAGDGPLREALPALARELKVAGYTKFVGNKTAQELPPYYAFATAFVLPSISEPWGLVVNEAMAAGLPVFISNRCGCAEDLVSEGENGYLFSPESEAEISACMQRIEALSPAQLSQMKQSSLNRVQTYSPENWASHLTQLIQTLKPA